MSYRPCFPLTNLPSEFELWTPCFETAPPYVCRCRRWTRTRCLAGEAFSQLLTRSPHVRSRSNCEPMKKYEITFNLQNSSDSTLHKAVVTAASSSAAKQIWEQSNPSFRFSSIKEIR